MWPDVNDSAWYHTLMSETKSLLSKYFMGPFRFKNSIYSTSPQAHSLCMIRIKSDMKHIQTFRLVGKQINQDLHCRGERVRFIAEQKPCLHNAGNYCSFLHAFSQFFWISCFQEALWPWPQPSQPSCHKEAMMGGAQRVKRVMPILQDSKVKMGFLHRLAAWASPKPFHAVKWKSKQVPNDRRNLA